MGRWRNINAHAHATANAHAHGEMKRWGDGDMEKCPFRGVAGGRVPEACENSHVSEENRDATEACENRHATEENRDATEACENRHATEENRNRNKNNTISGDSKSQICMHTKK